MRRFLLKLFRRRTLERDLESELTFHEEMTRANGNAIGLGNRVQVKEQARDFWRWTLLESLWRDVLHAVRQFRRASAFSLATVLTLGLAIGANTAIFSIVESVVLNPLPYPESDRLIDVNHGAGLLNIPSGMGMKLGLYHYYRDRAGTLEEIAVYRLSQPTLIDDGEPERILATRTTTTLASVMGISPALGR